ncbi:hypothetical protein E4O05_01110 [Treponema sp. OMZ 787]|uniref:hypothetical protein n=1 Tax=Treponema sp. OMZ 787 TaxID=2563669 RepID=UPI0020A5E4B9|nr:hypothetical protein [Treponema sp. OMZ 787]UTC62544.1 hypothetical protein E4O05_01110 [Treponema sp. OMZ 787]
MKKFIFSIFCFSFINLHAISPGFELNNLNVFFNTDVNTYAPQIISNLDTSAFLNFNFEFKNQNLFLQPGVFFKNEFSKDKLENKKIIRPFFRRLNYSAFTDYFSFQAGKDLIYFGEGIIKNYFYLNIPEMIKSDTALWHLKFDIPIKNFIIDLGSAFDTRSIDIFKKPAWYSVWTKFAYSSSSFFIGLESDMLFESAKNNKKEYTLKTALEVLFNLPLDFKIYSNAGLPIKFINKKIYDWGVLAGISKTFLVKDNDYSFTLIAEGAYNSKGINYGFFYSTGLKDYAQITAGLQGLQNKELMGIIQTELFISDFKFKIVYLSKNLLDKKDILNGILSLSVVLND